MPPETQQTQLKDLTAGLSEQQQAEFFKTLHEAGISPHDVELARLLHALQLYKAYYEAIPAEIQKAAAEIKRVKEEIESFSRSAHQSSITTAQLAGQVIQESEKVRKDLAQIHENIEKGMTRSAENIATKMAELLTAGIEKTVVAPLQNRLAKLAESSEAFDGAIARSKQAAATLHEHVTSARRFHFKTYAICGLAIVCMLIGGAYYYLYRSYEDRAAQERESLVGLIDKNRSVLLQLAKSHRALELHPDPEHPQRKLLVMKDASAWQSTNHQGVIEFEE